MIRLLIVDDSPLMRRLLSDIFAEAGDFIVDMARSADEALGKIASFAPDVVTLDIQMPGMDGLACLDRIMVEHPCPVVMVSALTEAGADETLEALALGAVDFIPKPRGPMSLEIDGIASELVAKVRSAATARISRTARLTDRVRRRIADKVIPARKPAVPARSSHKPGNVSKDRLSGISAILVGVSTGGPPALDALLQPLPADFPCPIVIAQHMPASFTGPLARRLDRNCALHVVEAAEPMPLEPGRVYIGRGDADLIFSRRGGQLHVLPAPSQSDLLWHPSTDRMVASARRLIEADALIGVLMTGMGYDGAAQMAALRRDGGHVVAQDEASAVVWGMPGALVAADGADIILPLHAIAAQLTQWVGR